MLLLQKYYVITMYYHVNHVFVCFYYDIINMLSLCRNLICVLSC